MMADVLSQRWFDTDTAQALIASCVRRPPVWTAVPIPYHERQTRDDEVLVSSDPRVVCLNGIREAHWAKVMEHPRSPEMEAAYDHVALWTPYAVIDDATPAPNVTEINAYIRDRDAGRLSDLIVGRAA